MRSTPPLELFDRFLFKFPGAFHRPCSKYRV